MYRPSLKSGVSLLILFCLSVILFVIAQFSYKQIRADYYEEKVEAAKLMERYLQTIRLDLSKKGFTFDPIDDPFKTGLIGTKLSTITTSKGFLSEKQTALNPNLAAVFIQLLHNARLKEGDYVAVGITGSNPGTNLALYAAMSVLKVKPVIICALSSSSYGANRDDFTWLDIESVLIKNKLIDFSTTYASLGGKDDLAIGVSDAGIESLRNAMIRNNVPLLIGNSLQENIELRMKAYQEMLPTGKRYRLFVNIGGAVANVGSERNANLIPEGVSRKLADMEFENPGVIMLFAKKNVPILHIIKTARLAKKYNLPIAPDKMPKPGVGQVFSSKIHNVLIASICLIILLIAIITVIVFDRYDRHFMQNLVDPDEEL